RVTFSGSSSELCRRRVAEAATVAGLRPTNLTRNPPRLEQIMATTPRKEASSSSSSRSKLGSSQPSDFGARMIKNASQPVVSLLISVLISPLSDFRPIQAPAATPGTCGSTNAPRTAQTQRDQIKDLRALLWDGKPAVPYMAALFIICLSSSKAA